MRLDLADLRRLFHDRRHTFLLATIISAFAVRPLIGDFGVAPVVFSATLLLILLVALYNIEVDDLVGDRDALVRERIRWSALAWTLTAVALAERIMVGFFPSPSLVLGSAVTWLSLMAFVTWTQMKILLRHREVTSETISMSISVYLLVGLTWGLLYIVLFQIDPRSLNVGEAMSAHVDMATEQHLFPIFVYFSMTTLATIGYGDITPVTLLARYVAVAEGVFGQFYLAVLVARLVGMQMSAAPGGGTRGNDA